ncbi:hypothetical protein DPSP01_006078 [Paraphaeosphaeria sporulosa]
MRSSLSLKALAFAAAALNGVEGIDLAKLRRYGEMAESGMYPDGSPMHSPEIMASILSAPAASAASAEPETIVPEYVELPLNHFGKKGSSDGTYLNRFWVSTEAYKPGAPVFLYDVGEADGAPYVATRLGRVNGTTTNSFRQMVDKYQGVGIVWEHRYYGNSTPGNVPITADTKPEVFKWLNTEQSLKDIVAFADKFSRPNINYTLTPAKTPWIMIGGSYPAMRTAFMRDQYPDTIFAGFASSAPTEAKVDMSVYFEPVARGMERYGAGNCSKDIHAAIGYIDKELGKGGKTAANLKQQFLGGGAEKNSHATFADALSTIFWLWQSYGMDGSPWSLGEFCNYLETDPVSTKVADKDGWAKTKGAKFVVDRWASWPKFAGVVSDSMDTVCSGDKNKTAECNLDLVFQDPSSVSWTWQYCTQWGYFQSANLGPNQLVSKYNSLQHQHDICHRQFPTAKAPLFPDWPQTDRTNAVFGGWDIRPSQLYWSGGEFDPWRTLSPLSAEPWAPHPKAFTNPPKCGQGQDEDEIFGYVLKNAQHCYDFRTTVALGETSRGFFYKALDGWLKCFKPKKGGY